MMRNTIGAICLLAALLPGAALACDGTPVCTVIDPTGTPLNVRAGPNGKILSTLKRGSIVEVVDHQQANGDRWALVASYGEAWGWVFGAYLNCAGEDELGRICTVADPTGTPLNIRQEPNGTVIGAWDNGVRVRPYEEQTVGGKVWYAVERFAGDNKQGWVFDAYLKCEEDGGH